MKSKNYILETVVCSSRSGADARLHRMLSTRQLLRRRTEGCLHAWVSRSSDGTGMFLVQAIYSDREVIKNAAALIEEKLDTHVGGIESLLSGPPLIGYFDLEKDKMLRESVKKERNQLIGMMLNEKKKGAKRKDAFLFRWRECDLPGRASLLR